MPSSINAAAALAAEEPPGAPLDDQAHRHLGGVGEVAGDGGGVDLGGHKINKKKKNKAQSHCDHRVAMSLAIGGLTAEQSMSITDTSCVDTSFPNFEKVLASLLANPA